MKEEMELRDNFRKLSEDIASFADAESVRLQELDRENRSKGIVEPWQMCPTDEEMLEFLKKSNGDIVIIAEHTSFCNDCLMRMKKMIKKKV